MRSMDTGFEKRALRALYELSQATMSGSNVDKIFYNILDKAMEIVGVTKASIMRFDPKEKTLKIIAARGIPHDVMLNARVRSGEGISGKVFASLKPLLVTDIDKSPEALRQKRYRSKSLISAPVTCFPLQIRGRAVGVINMTDKKSGKAFTQADLHLLSTIAAQAAAYVHIFDLVDDLKEGERLRQEVEIAKEIQSALLPHRMPDIKGVTAAGRCLVAERLGGDYYDYLCSGWAPPSFIVADVSGHDIGAALLMSAFRSALRSEAGIPVLPPSAVVRRMNRVLYNDLVRAEQFISMFYAQYIHSTRTLRYSSAGHPPALLYRPSKKSFTSLITEGPLIGIEKGEHFYDKKCKVHKGDVLVMYTDGLIEAQRENSEHFGVARLKRSIAKHAKKMPLDMIDSITNDVKTFLGPAPVKDDITLVVLKFRE